MAGVNKCILVGNLGKDPDIRSTQGGSQIASFSLATSESWRDKNSGERKEKSEWHNIVVFNENIVKIVENYCKKGSKVYVEGKLRTRKWQDKDGGDRYTTEVVLENFGGQIVLLDGKRDAEDRPSSTDRGSSKRPAADDIDSDIPF